jgi:hypothetical protein
LEVVIAVDAHNERHALLCGGRMGQSCDGGEAGERGQGNRANQTHGAFPPIPSQRVNTSGARGVGKARPVSPRQHVVLRITAAEILGLLLDRYFLRQLADPLDDVLRQVLGRDLPLGP